MVSQMLTLNILLVPILTLFITNKKDVKFSFNLLSQYVLATVLNVLCSKGAILLVRFFTDVNILLDSGYYTLIATIIAVIIGILSAFRNRYVDFKVEVSPDETEKN